LTSRVAAAAALLSCWTGFFSQALYGQLPHAGLTWIFPAGGRPGDQVEVQVGGVDLDDARRIDFSHPAITAVPKMSGPDPVLGRQRPEPGRFVVSIEDCVPPGVYEARVVGRYGISNARAFLVEDRPHQVAPDAPATPASALEIPLDTWIDSRCRPGQVDHFKVALQAGQRVVIDCWAQRIDSALDAKLVVENSRGVVLAASRDRWRRDPLVDFRAPENDHYIIKVRDVVYAGGEPYGYRLLVSTAPYLDFVFPPAGLAGATGTFTVHGYNLPSGTEPVVPQPAAGKDGFELASIQIPLPVTGSGQAAPGWSVATAGLETYLFRIHRDGAFSNAVPVGLATVPVVIEAEGNDRPTESQVLSRPCEVAGQFYPEGDVDWFQFQAAKGEAIWIEIISERLGLPTDPHLLVQHVELDATGATSQQEDLHDVDDWGGGVGGPGFDRPSRDPALLFVAPADGSFRLLVRDLEGTATAQPRNVYRLVIRPPSPDFLLACTLKQPVEDDPQKPRTWNPVLRRGGMLALRFAALRREGFADEIRLTAENLPAGVSCCPAVIPPGMSDGILVLQASDDAAVWEGPVEIVGTARVGEQSIRRTAFAASLLRDGDTQIPIRTESQLKLAVVEEPAPVQVQTAVATPVRGTKGSKLSIPLKITRKEGFKGDITLQPVGLPKEIQAPAVTIKDGAAEGTVELVVTPDTKPGDYTLFLSGRGSVSYRRNPAAAEQAELEKQAITKAAAELAAAAADAEKAKVEADAQVEQLRAATSAQAGQLDQATAARDELAKAAAELGAKAQAAEQARKESEQRAAQLAEAAKPADRAVYVPSNAVVIHIDESAAQAPQ
jgi:hypothetical protein